MVKSRKVKAAGVSADQIVKCLSDTNDLPIKTELVIQVLAK